MSEIEEMNTQSSYYTQRAIDKARESYDRFDLVMSLACDEKPEIGILQYTAMGQEFADFITSQPPLIFEVEETDERCYQVGFIWQYVSRPRRDEYEMHDRFYALSDTLLENFMGRSTLHMTWVERSTLIPPAPIPTPPPLPLSPTPSAEDLGFDE